MRKLRLLAAALLCLTLTAPALAVGAEQEEAAPWEQVVEWVKGWIWGGIGGEEPEPPAEPESTYPDEAERGPMVEPNG